MSDVAQPLFTCLSCSIAFHTSEEQREHYRSDHHRYNMKRRVASLPPVSVAVFNQKVLEKRAETAVTTSLKGANCEVCGKVYTTENAYRSHINSKKHKENEVKAALRSKSAETTPDALDKIKTIPQDAAKASPAENGTPSAPKDDVSDEESETLDQKLAASRNRIGVTSCLFCSQSFPSIDASLTHMSQSHGFFIPDADFLVDLPGLITYLGEKIAVHNICIYCNERGREFRSLDAVRKHMVDKSHCKIAYDSEREKLEVSDFYDFSSSYPDVMKGIRVRKVKEGKKAKETEGADEGWEDEDGDSVEVDDVIEEEVEDGAEATSSSEEEESDEEDIPPNEITYGDTPYELVLPSGARIGHRSLKRYYAQSFHPLPPTASSDPKSGQALVRQLLADKNSALVPRRGGFGAFGSGTEVVKARNRGEAKEAGRHIREFRDQQKREQHKTQVGFRHNHQKHYRDPLLQ